MSIEEKIGNVIMDVSKNWYSYSLLAASAATFVVCLKQMYNEHKKYLINK